jgi:pyruvate carboxylase subunit B
LGDIAAVKYVTTVEDKTFTIEVENGEIVVDGQAHSVDLRHIEPLSLYSLLIDNLSHEIFVEEQEGRYGAMLQGQLYAVDVQEERLCRQDLACMDSTIAQEDNLIAAPMPGVVLEVLLDVGETVQSGEVVVVLESMKMRIDLRSSQDGVIQAVHVVSHNHVAQGQALVTVSPQQ